MGLSKVDGDLVVSGTLTAGNMNIPAASVGNGEIEAAAAIAVTKLQHLHNIDLPLFDHATSVATVRKGLFRAESACTINSFKAYVTVAAGAATTVTVDLLKNGSSILSSTIDITNAHTAFQVVEGTLSSTALVANDILEVSVTLTGANPPKGLNACLMIDERGY